LLIPRSFSFKASKITLALKSFPKVLLVLDILVLIWVFDSKSLDYDGMYYLVHSILHSLFN
jgi:hypothetical protein